MIFSLEAVDGHLPARNIDPQQGDNGSMSEGWLVWPLKTVTCF